MNVFSLFGRTMQTAVQSLFQFVFVITYEMACHSQDLNVTLSLIKKDMIFMTKSSSFFFLLGFLSNSVFLKRSNQVGTERKTVFF